MYDIIIIGGGIIGSFLAHDLSKFKLKTAVIEKESDVANGATMANSAIIHSGHDPREGTLKAKLNVRGNQMYPSICEELSVEFKRTSAYVTAVGEQEEAVLDRLYKQAESRNIPVHYIEPQEAFEKEPGLNRGITKVMELPTTGIVTPWEAAIALMETAVINGTELYLNEKVKDIVSIESPDSKKAFQVITNKGLYTAKWIINAAGVYADQIYGLVSKNVNFRITPRKGEYYVLDKCNEPYVNRVIYPVPSELGKGVLAVPTIHGNVLVGPNSDFIKEKDGINNTAASLLYVKKQIAKTLENVPLHEVIRSFAGLRPSGDRGDFVIEESEDVENFINAACIESPGLASAPAISEYIIHKILAPKLTLDKVDEHKKRRPYIKVNKLSDEEKNRLVKRDPAFGRIICRCEQITEGEIIDAIRRPLGAKTIKGVKKRVRPGMGRCQGGFCEPLVMEILARELEVTPMDIRMDSEESVMIVGMTKGGC